MQRGIQKLIVFCVLFCDNKKLNFVCVLFCDNKKLNFVCCFGTFMLGGKNEHKKLKQIYEPGFRVQKQALPLDVLKPHRG